MENHSPSYLEMDPEEFRDRVNKLQSLASPCVLCPRECGALRKNGEKGDCRIGYAPVVSSVHPHHGEERPLSGTRGSGTIFLTNCNLSCVFCQNYEISHMGQGKSVTVEGLASAMTGLQRAGCHNINFVTPAHQIHAIMEAVLRAAADGLRLLLAYNTGGYDSIRTLKLLEGVFDIYMPALKFMDGGIARDLAEAADYPEIVQEALLEKHRQAGDLRLDENGIATRGMLVRHPVLPHNLAGSDEAFRFLAEKVSVRTVPDPAFRRPTE